MGLFCVSTFAAFAKECTPGTLDNTHFLIPGGAGGGWDRTARGVGEALVRSNILDLATYENMSGGGGARAIAHLIETGAPRTLMVNSTPIVVRSLQGVFPQTFRDLTPVASVIGDYSVIAVRSQSRYEDLHGLLSDLGNNPRGIPVAGGSVSGGTDHIFAALIARGAGVDARAVKYIPYDAGGKAMAGLLSGEVAALSSGFGEVVDLVHQGWVRLLCIASSSRLPDLPELPTCKEAGAPEALFVNWRGFFAAPSVPGETICAWQQMLADLQTTREWEEVRERYGWVELHHEGPDFMALLTEQEHTLRRLLNELELIE